SNAHLIRGSRIVILHNSHLWPRFNSSSLGILHGPNLRNGTTPMLNSTIERAKGRWPGILAALGIPANALTGKHGPCPMCGGKDRFRFSDNDGSGDYICSQCGAGYGMRLLEKFHGWDFKR